MTAPTLSALVRAHAAGDDSRFYSVIIQAAAGMCRTGAVEEGRGLRDLVDEMRMGKLLPPFSGPCPPCRKCGLPAGKAVGTSSLYLKEGDREFLERRCGSCRFTWYECCADVEAGVDGDACGGV